jgi:hypothetical protein
VTTTTEEPRVARRQVTLAIIPKPALPPAECQRLGQCIEGAMANLPAAEDRQGVPPGAASAIDDLAAGELPKTLVMRVMALNRHLKRKSGEQLIPLAASDVAKEVKKQNAGRSFAELCDIPAVFVIVDKSSDESGQDVANRVAALLPPDLIQGVRLFSREV